MLRVALAVVPEQARTAAGRASTSPTWAASWSGSGIRSEVLSGPPYPEPARGCPPHARAEPGSVPRARPVPHADARRVPRRDGRRRVPDDAGRRLRGAPLVLQRGRRGSCGSVARTSTSCSTTSPSGPGCCRLPRALPVVAMIHHPISVDRRVELAAASDAGGEHEPASLVRASCGCRRGWPGGCPTSSRCRRTRPPTSRATSGCVRSAITDHPGRGGRGGRSAPAAAPARVPARLVCVASARHPDEGRRPCCSRRWPSCGPSATPTSSSSAAPPGPATRARHRGARAARRRRAGVGAGSTGRSSPATYASAEVAVVPSLLRGVLAAGDRGDGVRDAGGGEPRGRAAGGAGRRRGARRGRGRGCAGRRAAHPAGRRRRHARGSAPPVARRVAERFTWERVGAATAEHLARAVERGRRC